MTEQQKDLLENWQNDELLNHGTYCENTDCCITDCCLKVTRLLQFISKLLRIQEAKTRAECAEIVDSIDTSVVNASDAELPWINGRHSFKKEAKQKILHPNGQKNE